MQKINPFFKIGTIGMMVTASLHVLLALLLSEELLQTSSSILYPVFLIFLIIGTYVMTKRKNNFPPN